MNTITVETLVRAPIEKVWDCWNNPKHIVCWCFASEDWEAPNAENNLQVGGIMKIRMSAKDKSSGFDFTGIYTALHHQELIEYDIFERGGRHVKIEFAKVPEGTKVTETFDPETENSLELQRNGWQAILNNFKKYVENKSS